MKLGIALSGGGIRGVAHAGALKALEEAKIKVDIIGGTSAGGLVASLYALGYSPYYIYILFKRYAKNLVEINSVPLISGIGNFVMNKKIEMSGLATGEAIEKAYDNIASKKGVKTIGDITKMPLVIPSVDMKVSKEFVFTNYIPKNCEDTSKYITNIPVGKAVRASSSFPAMFCPCEFGKHQFLDGGILDNVPVTEVKKQGADKVIAINFKSDSVNESSNIMDIAMRTLDIMGNKISEESLEKSDYILTIETNKTGLLDVEKLDECYKAGYDTVKQNLEQIKEL